MSSPTCILSLRSGVVFDRGSLFVENVNESLRKKYFTRAGRYNNNEQVKSMFIFQIDFVDW